MVDLLAYTSDFTVGSKLPNNILIVFGSTKHKALINWDLRVLNDVVKTKWAKFVPLILGGLECDAVGVLFSHAGVSHLLVHKGLWNCLWNWCKRLGLSCFDLNGLSNNLLSLSFVFLLELLDGVVR